MSRFDRRFRSAICMPARSLCRRSSLGAMSLMQPGQARYASSTVYIGNISATEDPRISVSRGPAPRLVLKRSSPVASGVYAL